MAGHSQFKNIMYRKGAQDKRKAKVFSKLLKEINVAAKDAGCDPEHNPRLRSAIIAARAENMPKDNIDRALKRIEGGDDASNYESIRYEGYSPYGFAIIVDALTDNKNRAASEIRTIFGKSGGTLGDTNSVAFLFDRVGCVRYRVSACGADDLFELVLNSGADNVDSDENEHEITCPVDAFRTVRDYMAEKLGDPAFAGVIWKPKEQFTVTDVEAAKSLMDFLEALDDNDAVQNVTSNFVFSDDVLKVLNNS